MVGADGDDESVSAGEVANTRLVGCEFLGSATAEGNREKRQYDVLLAFQVG